MAAVAGARAHRGVEDQEVGAHDAYAGDAAPGVIRSAKSSDEVGRSASKALHPTKDATVPSAACISTARQGRAHAGIHDVGAPTSAARRHRVGQRRAREG